MIDAVILKFSQSLNMLDRKLVLETVYLVCLGGSGRGGGGFDETRETRPAAVSAAPAQVAADVDDLARGDPG